MGKMEVMVPISEMPMGMEGSATCRERGNIRNNNEQGRRGVGVERQASEGGGGPFEHASLHFGSTPIILCACFPARQAAEGTAAAAATQPAPAQRRLTMAGAV